ncbi:MAG: hypothetical protein FWD05_12330 [Oscillospiraceae bacterium]|nr:hypothetical protein [Oscillospiraceae bacterium]
MHKPISEMATHLRNLLPPTIPQTFKIDPMFMLGVTEADVYKGISAFKDFLHHLYDHLTAEGSPFDKPKRESHNTNINSSYPFILHLAVFMMNMGLHGKLNDDKDVLLMDDIEALTAVNKLSYQKIPDRRKVECLRFLEDCGLRFGGLDICGKKPKMVPSESHGPIKITYPSNHAMLVGMKVIVSAQHDIGSKYIGEILLRCDWRALAYNMDNKVKGFNCSDILPILKDLTHTLPDDVQDFILKLHTDYMSHGYKCDTYIGAGTRFEYFCKSKELWRFNLTLNNGHFITIKAQNTDKYLDIVDKLPDRLQADIIKGYGCGKKMGTTDFCDGGCRGYRVPLDDSFLKISDVVKEWIEREVEIIVSSSN